MEAMWIGDLAQNGISLSKLTHTNCPPFARFLEKAIFRRENDATLIVLNQFADCDQVERKTRCTENIGPSSIFPQLYDPYVNNNDTTAIREFNKQMESWCDLREETRWISQVICNSTVNNPGVMPWILVEMRIGKQRMMSKIGTWHLSRRRLNRLTTCMISHVRRVNLGLRTELSDKLLVLLLRENWSGGLRCYRSFFLTSVSEMLADTGVVDGFLPWLIDYREVNHEVTETFLNYMPYFVTMPTDKSFSFDILPTRIILCDKAMYSWMKLLIWSCWLRNLLLF